MGFTTSSGGGGDVLTGLINLLGNPSATTARLEELSKASALNDQKIAELHAAEEIFRIERASLDAKWEDLARKQKELEIKLAEAKDSHALSVSKTSEAARVKAELESQRRNLNALEQKLTEEYNQKEYALKESRRQLAEQEKELAARSLALTARETKLGDREREVELMAADYKTEMSKFKSLVDQLKGTK